MLELLNEGEEPGPCYFADNDLIAAGALKAFRQKGFRIPQDIAIIGFAFSDDYGRSEKIYGPSGCPKAHKPNQRTSDAASKN